MQVNLNVKQVCGIITEYTYPSAQGGLIDFCPGSCVASGLGIVGNWGLVFPVFADAGVGLVCSSGLEDAPGSAGIGYYDHY